MSLPRRALSAIGAYCRGGLGGVVDRLGGRCGLDRLMRVRVGFARWVECFGFGIETASVRCESSDE